MTSILNKFAKVKIVDQSKSLLNPSDLEFCNQTEKDFLSAYSFYETKLEFLEINKPDFAKNKFISIPGMMGDIESSIEVMSKDFVEKIIRYFVNTYKITLSETEILPKLFSDRCFNYRGEYYPRGTFDREDGVVKDSVEKTIKQFKIPLDKILELITDKLDGMTLDEKAEQELKDKFYDEFAKSHHRERLEMIKNRIEFKHSYIDFETWHGWDFSWKSKERLLILFKALSFFENGSLSGILSEYDAFMNRGKVSEEVMFSEWQSGSEKVSGIRFYKNRKMIIKFVSDEVAQDFFKTMCRSGL